MWVDAEIHTSAKNVQYIQLNLTENKEISN